MDSSQNADSKAIYPSIAASLYISLTLHKNLAPHQRLVVRGATIVTQLMHITRFSRPEAISFCEDLVRDGVIAHVDRFHPFEDSLRQFRFNHACAEAVVTCIREQMEMNEPKEDEEVPEKYRVSIAHEDLKFREQGPPIRFLDNKVKEKGKKRLERKESNFPKFSTPYDDGSAITQSKSTLATTVDSNATGSMAVKGPVFDGGKVFFYRSESESNAPSAPNDLHTTRTFWRPQQRKNNSGRVGIGFMRGVKKSLKGILKRKEHTGEVRGNDLWLGSSEE